MSSSQVNLTKLKENKMKKILYISLLALAFVMPSLSQTTLTLYPDKDAMIRQTNYPPNINDDDTNFGDYGYYNPLMWTWSGYPVIYKSLIGIDLSQLPDNATITDAKLYLYATGHHVSNLTSGGGYKSNASYLRRITTSWSESTVTWNTAPTTVTNNQATLANSTAVDQDYEVDVTNLIKDIQANPTTSDGLMLGLVTEQYYAKMQFASSDHATSSMHPKLEITYTSGVSFPDVESFEFSDTKWEDTDGDNLDWTLRSGSTPSSSTGPSGANHGKYYAYVEASSPNYPSKTAFLLSPTYSLAGKENATISFDYHMYGTTMGTLELHVSTNGGTTWSPSSIWSKTGNQGNAWNSAVVDLSSYIDETVLLRFKATTGSSYRSDIAIDRISVSATVEASTSTGENFIFSSTAMSKSGTTGPMQQSIQYLDGLGRPIQETSIGLSPSGNDLVKPMEYDANGRILRNYLPFPEGDEDKGSFRDYETSGDDVLGMQEDFFQDHFSLGTNDPYAYSRTVFENSPLNRFLEQGAPGEDFSPIEETSNATEHVQEFEYGTNLSSEVRCFTVNASTGALENSTSYYAASSLFVNTSFDEDGNETEEFKDKIGRVILKRSYEGTTAHSTHYVYDEHGLLRYVLPPKALGDNGVPTSTVRDQLCYYYEYDGKNRMIEKKLPGVDPVYMVYDHRDRLVGTQDGELRNSNEWVMTKYEALNRPVITARVGFSSAVSQSTVQGYITTFYNNSSNEEYEEYSGSGNGYSDQSYPDLSSSYYNHVLTVTFYDNYDFLSLSQYNGLDFDDTNNIDAYDDGDGASNGYFDRVSRQVTGTSAMILDGDNDTWIRSATYYDHKYRVIQTQTGMYPQGSSMVSTEYDFLGNVMQSQERQTVNSVTTKARYLHTYDHANRLLDTYVYYNSDDAVILAQNKYDELGQLEIKNLHSDDNTDFTQEVDYSYNIRGWLTSINDPASLGTDKFGMELFYQNVSGSPTSTAKYNGNIAAFSWVHNGESVEGYAFDYDDLNRLEEGDYKTLSGSSWTDPSYFGTSYSYDKNGNIETLTRNNSTGTAIDNLTYTYVGNQLDYINDAGTSAGVNNTNLSGTDYTYDDNGNMEWDKNKDMKVDYNYLNLPEKIYEESGTGDELLYIYDANGTKWLKKLTDGSTITKTMYAGSFVYEDIDNDAVDDFDLDYILNPEGKIDKLTSSVEYHYNLKDHLGNTRVLFDGTGTVKQKTDYYPFGMTAYQYSSSNDNKYLYNGKELQDEQLGGVNLDWYDYGARFYDPALGRFHTQDRFAEKYLDFSPYQYAANNPILYIDVNGDSINVAGEQNREQLNNDLTNAFGDKASNFSYTESGNLVYNGNGKKDFKGDQRKAFKGLDKVMSSEGNVELKYSETHTDAYGIEVDVVNDQGGGLYDADQNMIVISPNTSDIDVWEYSDNPVQQLKNIENPTKVKQNTTSTLFHEIGEVNAGKSEYRGSVIDYENSVRGIMKMNSRPPDMYHHPKPATQTNQ